MKSIRINALMVVGVLLFLNLPLLKAQEKKSISFDNIFDGTFKQESVQKVNWMKDGRYYSALKHVGENGTSEIRKYDILNEKYEILVKSNDLIPKDSTNPIQINDYQFSSDEHKLLLKTDVIHIWRRTTRAYYYVYDLQSQKLTRVSPGNGRLSEATLSPDGDMVAYVRDNNLYYMNLDTGKQTQITTDGAKNKIINGLPDWVYEEEFDFFKAFKWSPDGKRIVFYRFDERRVPEYQFPEYGGTYPSAVKYKYPKAGYPNSIVKIGVYDLGNGSTKWMDIGQNTDQYIPRVNWTQNPEVLAIRRMNRLQNHQDLMLGDVITGKTHIIKTETNKAWIDVNDDLTFLNNGKEFLYVSEEDGYNHIYLYKMDGTVIRKITKGDWSVTNIAGINQKKKTIYYLSTENSPIQRQLYSIRFNGEHKRQLTTKQGVHNIDMSPDAKYYLDYASNLHSALEVTLHDASGKQLRMLEDNSGLKKTLSEYNMPDKELTTVTVDDSVKLNACMIKPPNFNPNKKYPVLFTVYGGPGSQSVMDHFGTGMTDLWHDYLATKGYIIFCVDNRGTGGRGQAFEKIVYKNLGHYEVHDQIAAAKYLQTLPYVEANRIGIWGWSYGGYMSTFSLERGNDVFKMAIAVAPVTSWRYYDTIYTERYMQTPQLNPKGYEESAPLNYANQIKGKYLLVQGTGDDNVHFENSVMLVNQLIKYDIPFQTMYFPNRNHSIYGGNSRRYLFELLSRFVFKNL
ncbi:MAG TPA: S9 family peptidase [Balneolales bacterium]|nr:S9 family peptidase [Balneolales bacterium]